jgi:hypothetical protein
VDLHTRLINAFPVEYLWEGIKVVLKEEEKGGKI